MGNSINNLPYLVSGRTSPSLGLHTSTSHLTRHSLAYSTSIFMTMLNNQTPMPFWNWVILVPQEPSLQPEKLPIFVLISRDALFVNGGMILPPSAVHSLSGALPVQRSTMNAIIALLRQMRLRGAAIARGLTTPMMRTVHFIFIGMILSESKTTNPVCKILLPQFPKRRKERRSQHKSLVRILKNKWLAQLFLPQNLLQSTLLRLCLLMSPTGIIFLLT